MKILRKIILGAALALAIGCAHAQVALLAAATATGAGTAKAGNNSAVGVKTYQAVCRTTNGTGSAVVAVEGSNDGANFDSIGTITLSLTTSAASGSFTSQDRYTQNRGNVTTLTGTGATCNLTMGY
jgi:hypothetical protein